MKKLLSVLFCTLLSTTAYSAQVAETETQISPLLNGQTIPNAEATTLTGDKVQLSTFLNNKPTVLFFYRGGWCPFCNVQMGQLQTIEKDLKALGFQLIGISTDSPKDMQKSMKNKELSYQLLSDYKSEVSQAFGLAFFASQKVTERYIDMFKLQNPLQKNAQGKSRLVLPVPAVYVLDSAGLVHFQYVNPNYKVRLSPELLLKAAQVMPQK